MHPHEILEKLPSLPRPLVLLESGAGRPGKVRLAYGAKRRHRIEWDELAAGTDIFARLPRNASRLYGVLAYDAGLPPNAVRREPMIPQPAVDLFEPEHELVLESGRSTTPLENVPLSRKGEGTGEWARKREGTVEWARSFTEESFAAAVQEIRNNIGAGNVYQVNLSVAERYRVSQSPWETYLRLREINPSPWMGFADFGDWQLVSGSPELLVERFPDSDGTSVLRTRPIAGTRKKTGDSVRDNAMRSELRLDAKEQAEHRMLVDLARNDLGRVADFGTVEVSEREVVEEYSHVFHLVSEVRARVATRQSPWDVFLALFPGGTITGTPKISAMEIISRLEPVARGMYTGALGWVGRDDLQFNILIRSAVMRGGEAVVQAGAGIVWDSDPAREWRESLRKAAAMRAALGVVEPGA